MEAFDNKLESLKQILSSQTRQSWLFGAGISCASKVPLMYPLTKRIEKLVEDKATPEEKIALAAIKGDLNEDSHVEHYLSHLGDFLAIAERSKSKSAYVGGKLYSTTELKSLYKRIIIHIGDIVRYGYVAENSETGSPEEVGLPTNPIVEISKHYEFVEALLLSQSDLERRFNINFFTTNYDTLLEDALALHKKIVCDGFSGGSVGFWNAETEFSNSSSDASAKFYTQVKTCFSFIINRIRF